MTKKCKEHGGFWVTHSIHDQEWISYKNCYEKDNCEVNKSKIDKVIEEKM
jgi:hypothetical protein